MLNHLIELRRRLLFISVVFLALFLLFFYFSSALFSQLVAPLLQALPGHESLIATQITAPLVIPIKLAADVAILCTAPYALLQIWLFVAPGLYRGERHSLGFAICGSMLLFGMGILFCFYIVLPFMLQFFAQAVPKGVRLMPDITYAIDFITHMLLLFGLCFQVPLLCFFLVFLGLVDISLLKKIRPYIIVSAFTIGMLLTPPDVLSQIMLAVPLCLLYELGIILAMFVRINKLGTT